METVLCVDDEPGVLALLDDCLARAGYTTVLARSVAEALGALRRGDIDLIVSDQQMPGLTGLDLLELVAEEVGRRVPLILVTGYGTIEHAVSALQAGASDYLTKPLREDALVRAVTRVLHEAALQRENAQLRKEVSELRGGREIVGGSPAIRRVMQTVAMAAPTRATVLIQGESGTGKELVARAIHAASDRSHMPFIQLNCAAIPEGLIESSLFGHEKGAFTGAVRRVEGAFERAHRGTLLLDEVSEMRLDLQAKLLRVLQEQEFERVGGTSPMRVDVRIIATTNRDLAAEAAAGTFRQDLFYRLSVIPLRVPPLRERADDIARLAWTFAVRTAEETGKRFAGISEEALSLLSHHSWPGNVRELQHAVERAVILSDGPVLLPSHFPLGARGPFKMVAAPTDDSVLSLDRSRRGVFLETLNVDVAEQALIARALEECGGNRTKAAALLGISVRTLRNKLYRRTA